MNFTCRSRCSRRAALHVALSRVRRRQKPAPEKHFYHFIFHKETSFKIATTAFNTSANQTDTAEPMKKIVIAEQNKVFCDSYPPHPTPIPECTCGSNVHTHGSTRLYKISFSALIVSDGDQWNESPSGFTQSNATEVWPSGASSGGIWHNSCTQTLVHVWASRHVRLKRSNGK